MELNIISFGKIAEFIKTQTINIEALENTDQIKVYLERHYPGLAEIKYILALNNTLIQGKTEIKEGATIAIMPPFSGG